MAPTINKEQRVAKYNLELTLFKLIIEIIVPKTKIMNKILSKTKSWVISYMIILKKEPGKCKILNIIDSLFKAG
jgi:hypothetical protein